MRPCIGANVCINSLLEHKPLTCLANPDVGEPVGPLAETGAMVGARLSSVAAQRDSRPLVDWRSAVGITLLMRARDDPRRTDGALVRDAVANASSFA